MLSNCLTAKNPSHPHPPFAFDPKFQYKLTLSTKYVLLDIDQLNNRHVSLLCTKAQ